MLALPLQTPLYLQHPATGEPEGEEPYGHRQQIRDDDLRSGLIRHVGGQNSLLVMASGGGAYLFFQTREDRVDLLGVNLLDLGIARVAVPRVEERLTGGHITVVLPQHLLGQQSVGRVAGLFDVAHRLSELSLGCGMRPTRLGPWLQEVLAL